MNNWKQVKLEEVAESINAGGTPFRKEPTYWENGTIPWLKISDLKSKYVYDAEEKITKTGLENSSAKLFPEGTILYSIFATIGAIGILKKESTANQAIAGIVPNKKLILPDYLYYCLLSEKTRIYDKRSHATQDNINLTILRNHKIPLPPIETQKKIISILEKAEKIKEKRKEANKISDSYMKSLFVKFFGNIAKNDKNWNVMRAGDLFDIKLGKMLSAKNYTGKNLRPYLRNANVQWGRINLSDINQMDFNDKEFEIFRLKKGDILVCEGGEVGRTAIYQGEIEGCCYQNALHRLRIKNKAILPEYFFFYMWFAAKYGLIIRETIQVTIAHFTAEKFNKFKILIPPIETQKLFAQEVRKLNELTILQQKNINYTDILFDSLMQKAFNGELV